MWGDHHQSYSVVTAVCDNIDLPGKIGSCSTNMIVWGMTNHFYTGFEICSVGKEWMLETVNLGNSLWLVKSQKGVDLWPNDLINFYIPNCTQAFCLRREFFFLQLQKRMQSLLPGQSV